MSGRSVRFSMEPGNLVTFSVGLLFIAGAVFFYSSRSAFIENARETSAVVVDVVYESTTKKGRMHPTLRFRADGRGEITATPQQHHNSRPGDTVLVVYDARDPADVEVGTLAAVKHRRLLISGLAALVGVVVCTMGVGLDANTLRWRLSRNGTMSPP